MRTGKDESQFVAQEYVAPEFAAQALEVPVPAGGIETSGAATADTTTSDTKVTCGEFVPNPPADYPTRLTAIVGEDREALSLVAAYLTETAGVDPEAYLVRLAETAASAPRSTSYPPGLYAAFWLSLEQVEAADSASGALLAYLAAAPVTPIPPQAFQFPANVYPAELAPVIIDSELRSRVIDSLHRYTLLDQEPVSGWLSLAEGTRDPLRDLLGDQLETWSASAASVIESIGLLNPTVPLLLPDDIVTLAEIDRTQAISDEPVELSMPLESPRAVTEDEPIEFAAVTSADVSLPKPAEDPPAAVQVLPNVEFLNEPELADVSVPETEPVAQPPQAMPAAKPSLVARLFGRR